MNALYKHHLFTDSREEGGNYDLATQTLTVEFAMFTYKNESFIGEQYWVGAAIEISSTQIWAGQMFVEIVNASEGVNTLVNTHPKHNKHDHHQQTNSVENFKRVAVLDELIHEGGREKGGWVKAGYPPGYQGQPGGGGYDFSASSAVCGSLVMVLMTCMMIMI